MESNCGWRKSSKSGGNGCVEVGVARTSSHTTNGSCVEVEGLPEGGVAVRDSKYAKRGEVSPILKFSPKEWEELLDSIENATFNWRTFVPLKFNDEERRAFVLGVLDREFNQPTRETV